MKQFRHAISASTRAPLLFAVLLCLALLARQEVARAGGLQDLDAKSRRAIREAQIDQYGSAGRSSGSAQPGEGSKGVSVTDTRSASGKKKCVVKVGEVISSQKLRGARQENVTYVDGDVVNVCE